MEYSLLAPLGSGLPTQRPEQSLKAMGPGAKPRALQAEASEEILYSAREQLPHGDLEWFAARNQGRFQRPS